MTELPTTFGKYYLTEKLATGGMAEIYLAKLIGPGGFEKQLVIKQIQPSLTGQRQFVDMFVAEAKTLVTLAHGNIVPVYELGVVDETYYIAMDYIDGPTLYRLTEIMARKEARMPPAVAAWIVARILEGLDYAHRKGEGVVHRDLSPRNVMLSRDGEVKLVDFGIAVTLGGPEIAGRDAAPTGSFPYMSPEQVRRETLTAQTDLFSTGVLLWEMLAGQRLFHRADADATLRAVEHDPIRAPSTVNPAVPAKLDEVVMRALERDRSARWPTAADMLGALHKHLYALDETPGPRDVAALVALYCPPESRRLPTHADVHVLADTDDAPALADTGGDRATMGTTGPSTAVLPRALGPTTAVVPRGKPQRHKSFATNVDLAPILDAVPAEPSTDATTATTDLAAREPAQIARDDDDDEPPITRPGPTAMSMPGREPPSRAMLVVAGIGGIGLAIGAIVIFMQGREQVLASSSDASLATAADASIALEDAPTVGDARPLLLDAATLQTPATLDAGSRRADGGLGAVSIRPDARVAIDAGTAAAATATLQIGADPWGDIVVDGAAMGRTPKQLVVPAGHHTVEIVFPAESPPRTQTFSVDLGAGETKPLQADFTN